MFLLKTFLILSICKIVTSKTIHDGSSQNQNVTSDSRPFIIGGKTYYLQFDSKKNFQDAADDCKQQGLQLLSINSEIENTLLGIYIGDRGYVYIGIFWSSGKYLRDDDNNKRWVWTSTGENVTFTNWSKGEPNDLNNKEDCIEVRNWEEEGFSWNDLDCSMERYYICEKFNSIENN